MRVSRLAILGFTVLFFMCLPTALSGQDYLGWSQSQIKKIGKEYTEKGKVKQSRGVMGTNKATSYKYRVTWLTPSVIKATARFEQIRKRLSAEKTQKLVNEAESSGPTVFLVELDAIEGSGVIPPDWLAFLQPAKLPMGSDGCMRGTKTPELWKVIGLAGTNEKDYKYERFWMVFPLSQENGQPLFSPDTEKAELIIRINDRESTVTFKIPEDVKEKGMRLNQTAP